MNDIVRIITNPRRGRAVVYNGMVLLGGQTADDRSLDIKGQTKQALAKIDKVLAAAGTDKSRLLSAQIWIKDIAKDFAGMNEVWDAWVAPDALPTRATAQCQMGSPEVLVEIIVTAAVTN
ncbi:MAG: RidA family protein [Pseudomonadota bacterium]